MKVSFQLSDDDLKHFRKVMREVELRGDLRACCVVSLLAYCGLRVSDLVGLELDDVEIGPLRSPR